MSTPAYVRETLLEVGQLASEVPCHIDGYREFVSVYSSRKEVVLNYSRRFPYFDREGVLYRAVRFRLRASLIDEGVNVTADHLADLQEIYVQSLQDIEYIMKIWNVPLEELRHPVQVDIPL